jgi:hypothetical protein
MLDRRRLRSSRSSSDTLARSLGYFSLALGAAEALAPSAMARMTGLEGRDQLIRAYGVRELATGLAILASHDATPWIWGRVAGDALDLATLASGATDEDDSRRQPALASMVAVGCVTALDAYCAISLSAEKGTRRTATHDYRSRSGFPQGREAARGDGVRLGAVAPVNHRLEAEA